MDVTTILYPLEKVRFIIKDACQLDITYVYDDLVFAEHGVFLLQFMNPEGTQLACWFNNETTESDEIRIFDSLVRTASLNDCSITFKGHFSMEQKAGTDEIDIKFVDFA